MERYTYSLFDPREGHFAYGSDLDEMIDSAKTYRANGYPEVKVVRQRDGKIMFPDLDDELDALRKLLEDA